MRRWSGVSQERSRVQLHAEQIGTPSRSSSESTGKNIRERNVGASDEERHFLGDQIVPETGEGKSVHLHPDSHVSRELSLGSMFPYEQVSGIRAEL